MTEVDLRLDARWVLPVDPAGLLDHHSLLIDEARIVAIVPTTDVAGKFEAREHLTLPTHVLLPGLVNAHTHAAMSLLRGVADDVPLKAWLEQSIWPRESRFVDADFVHDGTLLAAAEMIRGGVTCCNDMYFFPGAAARAYRASGMRAMLGMPVLDFPTPYATDADGYLNAGLAARDEWKHEPRLLFCLAPHAPYTVADATWAKIVTFARQLDLIIQTHLLETREERVNSVSEHSLAPLQRLHRLGATGPAFIAIHAVDVDPADIELLAAQHCHVVHCPTSNLKLASGIAPVSAMIRAGINVALGSDGAASNNRLDVFGEARLASLIAKVAANDPAALPATEVLRMATLGGATALGLDEQIGSLAPGKQADAIAVDLGGVSHAPCYDPVSHLVNVTGRDQVSDVWVAGERLLADGKLTRIDADGLASRARFWHDRLQ
jgi:5-methylthioadenosine/S-adenosylhomocysteine deaminase